jgi:hypothetical protein
VATLSDDNFDRADVDPLDNGWTTKIVGKQAIVSNAVTISTTSPVQETLSVQPAVTWPANQWGEVTIGSVPAFGERQGVALRASGDRLISTDNFYVGLVDNANTVIEFYSVVVGSYTLIASYPLPALPLAVSDRLYLEIQGAHLAVALNGSSFGGADDFGIASGSAGPFCYSLFSQTVRVAAWRGGDFVSSASQRVGPRRRGRHPSVSSPGGYF